MTPATLAQLFAQATVVIGVDTGLVHLAAAVGAPVLALFTATDPFLTGVLADAKPFTDDAPSLAITLGGNGRVPTVDEALHALHSLLPEFGSSAKPYVDELERSSQA